MHPVVIPQYNCISYMVLVFVSDGGSIILITISLKIKPDKYLTQYSITSQKLVQGSEMLKELNTLELVSITPT